MPVTVKIFKNTSIMMTAKYKYYHIFLLVVSIISAVVSSYDISKPILNVDSKVDIITGTNFSIKCEGIYKLDWIIERNSIIIETPPNIEIAHTNDSEREIYKHATTLNIFNANANDTGYYKCINKHIGFLNQEAAVYIFVNDVDNLFATKYIPSRLIYLYKSKKIPCLPTMSSLTVTLWKIYENKSFSVTDVLFDSTEGFKFDYQSISSEFTGDFICKTSYRNYSQELSFKLLGSPGNDSFKGPVIYVGSKIDIKAGSTLELNCTGELPLTWEIPKRNTPVNIKTVITQKDYKVNMMHVNELKIENIQYFHTGLYRCTYDRPTTFDNSEGAMTQVYVFVNDPDHLLIKDPPPQDYYRCSANVIYCLPTYSNLNVTLRKGNNFVPIKNNVSFDSTRGFILYDNQPVSYLYTCKADYGNKSSDLTVSSVPLGGNNNLYLSVSKKYPFEGDEVQIVCEACSYEYNEIIWKKKDNKGKEVLLRDSNTLGIQIINESTITSKKQILKFSSIKPRDNGSYQCIAVKQMGSNTTKSVSLQITAFKKPVFVKTNMNGSALFLQPGVRHDFYCFVEGIPFPVVSWYKNNASLKKELPGVEFSQSDQVLTINRIIEEDIGVYVCNVKNRKGSIVGMVTVVIGAGGSAEMLIEERKLSKSETFLIVLFVILLILLLASIIVLIKWTNRIRGAMKQEEMCIPEMMEIDEDD